MASIVNCPTCDRPLQVPDDLLGQRVQCIRCQTIFTAPTGSETSAPPAWTAPVETKPSPTRPPQSDWNPCPHCGTRNHRDDRRCQLCGQALEDEPAALADRPWERPPVPPVRRDCEPERGGTILVLGVISIVAGVIGISTACCYGLGAVFSLAGIGLGIAAWVMGQRDLRDIRAGTRDPRGEGNTQAGWICGIVGTILNALVLLAAVAMIIFFVVVVATAASAPPPTITSTPPGFKKMLPWSPTTPWIRGTLAAGLLDTN
ncbi:MAG: hypothetical protein ACK4RK_04220 [Gemmataceae bacterium]